MMKMIIKKVMMQPPT